MKSEFDFKEVLKEEALKININLSDEMLQKFEIYKDLLIEWNEKMNLTAITEEYEIIMKHFIDCLEIVKYIDKSKNIIDVGTGAGFPGVVIAIYFNNAKITLLDSLNKRLIFLQEVIEKLKLENVEIVHGRAEELAHLEKYREKYDVVVSRAVANLTTLLEYDIGYLKVGGIALFLKADSVDVEIENARNAMGILGCKIISVYDYSYNIHDEIFTRKVLKIKKNKITNEKYPRNFGKIKKSPL